MCDLRHLPVEAVEQAVLCYYAHLDLPSDFADSVRQHLTATLADEQHLTRTRHDNLSEQLAKLDVAEERLLDLAADGAVPAAKIRTRLTKIEQERMRIRGELSRTTAELAVGAQIIETSLDLLQEPQEIYRQASDNVRQRLNQTFFQAFYVDEDEVTWAALQPPFDEIHNARQLQLRRSTPHPHFGTIQNRHHGDAAVPVETKIVLLADLYQVGGSSKPVMVGVA